MTSIQNAFSLISVYSEIGPLGGTRKLQEDRGKKDLWLLNKHCSRKSILGSCETQRKQFIFGKTFKNESMLTGIMISILKISRGEFPN